MQRLLASVLIALAVTVAACQGSPGGQQARPAPAPVSAPLPAEARGDLTFQRDGNVFSLALQSKAERKLTDFPAPSPAVFSARSPDGQRLAYVRVEGLGSVLWVANADGSGARQLVDASSAGATLERPQWTPDGTAIIYTHHGFQIEGTRILGELFRADRVEASGGPPTTLAEEAEGPTQAPSGALAFVRTTRTGQQLVVRDAAGAEKVVVPERTFLSIAAPRFSRDGQRIAFVAVGDGPQTSWRAPAIGPILGERSADRGWPGLPLGPPVAHAHGEPWDIWVAEIGGGVRRVNKLGEDEPTVAWNEDDRYLAVSGGTGVYVLEVANGQASQVAKAGGFGGIDWTP